MLVEKKISSKINYDVLRELSDENSTQEPKVDSNITPSVEATPATPSSAPRKRTFSLLDSGGSASTINRNVSSYHSTSAAPSRYVHAYTTVLVYDYLSCLCCIDYLH